MITISKPRIDEREGSIYLVAHVKDEVYGFDTDLWYSVPALYKAWLCEDYADAFLVGLLTIAAQTGQEVKIAAPVSRRLLFHVRNCLLPLYQKVFDSQTEVLITAQADPGLKYNASAVATGCSLGVDSLSSIFKHLELPVESGYKLTHLAFFNCGQLGDCDNEQVLKNMQESLRQVEGFASELGLPLIVVNSNINDFYAASNVGVLTSVTTRTASCALALQKALGRYVYASDTPADRVCYDIADFEHMDSVIVPLLSSDNLEVLQGDAMLARTEKTRRILNYNLARKYLTVCWAGQAACVKGGVREWLARKVKRNCGWCGKCLRTLLTMELLGSDLNEYGDSFDLQKYYRYRGGFIAKIVAEHKKSVFYDEIYQLMPNHMRSSLRVRMLALSIIMGKAMMRVSLFNMFAQKIRHLLRM